MWTFLTLVTAVVAIVIAKRALNEVRELRKVLETHRPGAGGTAAEAAAPQATQQAPPAPQPERGAGAPPAVPPAPSRPEPEPEPVIPIWQPPPIPEPVAAFEAAPPPPPPPPKPPTPRKPPVWQQIDWESFVGVKLFSWVAGVAMVIAAIYFLKYSVEHGWISPPIRAAIGLITGSALLVICELRVSRAYKFTANAMLGAGIAILYATLFAVHALWHLLPSVAVFGAMIIVTAVAVLLSIRRDALFIALLGMMGGFATPALLSTGENRPIGLFSYLLLLNAGLAWVAYKKRWPALTVGTVIFSAVYQWAWIAKFLDVAQLPLAAGIFLVFGIAAASALWIRRDDRKQAVFDRLGQLGAALPLLFALFAAAVPAYGARFHILFGFLLLMAAGLGVIAMLRGIEWLHALGVVATVLTFAIWLAVSYTPDAWPTILAWVSAFVILYLAIGTRLRSRIVIGGAVLLFVIPALVQLEPRTASPVLLFSVLFALLALAAAYAIRYEEGLVYFVAAFFAIIAEAFWSVKHLNEERLYAGLAIYGVFGLLFLGVPALARRFNRPLRPENGVGVTVVVSVAMLLFLTTDTIAAGALWGLALLLALLLIGAMTQARFTRRPLLAAIAVILAWIVLASWWEGASLELALIPALFVVAVFGILVVLSTAWARFEGQTHLALAGHAFLIFVAASRTLAFPPWPFLAVLLVLDLAIGVAALYLKRSSLVVGAAVMSQIVLLSWTMITDLAPWPNVALAATLGVAAYAIAFTVIGQIGRRGLIGPMSPIGPIVALFLGHIVAIAAGTSADDPLFGTLLATHAVLAIATLILAARTEMHVLAVLSVPLTAIGTMLARTLIPAQTIAFAFGIYAIYIFYPLLLGPRAKRALEPYLAAVFASVPFFFIVREAMNDAGLTYMIGVLPVAQSLVMLSLVVQLLRVEPPAERQLTRLAIVAASSLAFLTIAVPLQLDKQWITIAWALEGAALVWLYRRIPHRGLLAWAAALLVSVFVRLTINPDILSYHPSSDRAILNWYLYTYLVSALAFFVAAYLAPREYRRAIGALRAAGTLLLFFLLNIEIADYFSTGSTLTFNFLSSSLAQDLTYTIGWAVFAIAMLIAGIALHSRPSRVAAIALLVVTIFKCFLHDLGRLGGLYRIASFLGLALALVMVSVLLQKFVLARRVAPEEVAP
ncbi:MAG TPA: DUF2339 domain-containing protein [Thermoanaerobaculia bacterium]|jgi:uncharacterized membrane protein|nr:DUF2339 domain-containing protein [Thermoanaerobaculia bacterium]